MRTLARIVERYIDQNLEPKTIAYVPSGKGFTPTMTTGKERIKKTSKVIAEEIVDLILDKLNSKE